MTKTLLQSRSFPNKNKTKINLELHNTKSNLPPNLKTFEQKIISGNGDWTEYVIGLMKKKYLIHYRMLKFYVRYGMIVEKIHEVTSFKQSKCLEKHKNFNTQKRLKMNLKKISMNYGITHFM